MSLADGALYIAKKRAGRNAWVGLLGSEKTTAEAVLRSLQAEPDQIIQEAHLEVRASKELESADTPGETQPSMKSAAPEPTQGTP